MLILRSYPTIVCFAFYDTLLLCWIRIATRGTGYRRPPKCDKWKIPTEHLPYPLFYDSVGFDLFRDYILPWRRSSTPAAARRPKRPCMPLAFLVRLAGFALRRQEKERIWSRASSVQSVEFCSYKKCLVGVSSFLGTPLVPFLTIPETSSPFLLSHATLDKGLTYLCL
ncbi:hypothetical protein FCM35_KLT11003 [Carex littledalei]|uniref:Uncharacterized protein n=1 Tax=Carex littledalei TaxID=544730 RepID=A0A833QT73_9POAL|nr:hypothetical protein FCM35_KLT11003 [Carex littledalei]